MKNLVKILSINTGFNTCNRGGAILTTSEKIQNLTLNPFFSRQAAPLPFGFEFFFLQPLAGLNFLPQPPEHPHLHKPITIAGLHCFSPSTLQATAATGKPPHFLLFSLESIEKNTAAVPTFAGFLAFSLSRPFFFLFISPLCSPSSSHLSQPLKDKLSSSSNRSPALTGFSFSHRERRLPART